MLSNGWVQCAWLFHPTPACMHAFLCMCVCALGGRAHMCVCVSCVCVCARTCVCSVRMGLCVRPRTSVRVCVPLCVRVSVRA